MAETTHLALPYIDAAQAQKHVTHNEALQRLDALVQLSVIARGQSAPPASPTEGERYLVGAGASGAFAGKDFQIAVRLAGAWTFLVPRAGWSVYVAAERLSFVHDGSAWIDVGLALRSLQNLERFGLGATADGANPFSVKLNAALFAAKGAGEGGSGDLRFTLNKSAPANTVSQLYQTNWSGRAETGLTGDDHFRVKVSADGSSWKDAIDIDPASGRVAAPFGHVHAPTGKTFSDLLFTPGGDGQVSIYRNDASRAQNPRSAAIAGVASDVITLVGAGDASLFYANAQMVGVSYVRIWNMSRNASAWVKYAPAGNQLQVTAAGDIASWAAGEVVQIGDPPSVHATGVIALDISPMLQNVLGAVFPQGGILVKSYVAGPNAGLGLSGDALSGSFVWTYCASDGAPMAGMALVPCVVPSPISNSNLVFVKEAIGAPNEIGVAHFSSLAVFG